MRTFWKWLIDNETTYEKLTAQLFELTFRMDADTALDCVRCLVLDGFQNLNQLRGVYGNAWQCKRMSTKQALEAVARHVTALHDVQRQKDSVLSVIDRMLQSANVVGPVLVRPEGGPKKAVLCAGIGQWSAETKRRRLDDARVGVTLDSITGGKRSYVSAVRGYLVFMRELFPDKVPVPPAIDDLLLWSQFFKHGGTFATYCSAVRWVSEGCGVDTAVFSDPLLRRAKKALKLVTRPKQKRWIGASLARKLMRAALERMDATMAMMYLGAYVFLARVPSELLTWQFDGMRLTNREAMDVSVGIQYTEVEMRVHMTKRKNAQLGDSVRRACSCHLCRALCPIHVLGPWLSTFEIGGFPFGSLSASTTTRKLRMDLEAIGVTDAILYSLHSFRRGGANDMKELGCSVEDLQRAGGWNSRACFDYIMPEDMDVGGAIAFMVDDSDSD